MVLRSVREPLSPGGLGFLNTGSRPSGHWPKPRRLSHETGRRVQCCSRTMSSRACSYRSSTSLCEIRAGR